VGDGLEEELAEEGTLDEECLLAGQPVIWWVESGESWLTLLW
jgi:hypothetical protein